ncbi:MAG: class I SAM-dependent methyltransferase [Hyphomicrobium sp.]|uniref:class I SAM-dependent methyltransferase n=1 Tax=Hyphomicrobium sp. TaxID=82 RepID=UPI003D0B9711
MTESVLYAWWERLRGRLRPRPCPYALASALEVPGRRLVAGPVKVLNAFGVMSGTRVLEIGPGTGFYSVEACRRVGTAGRVFCLDVQSEMLRDARQRVIEAGLAADFICGDAQALPLRDASVDHVYLIAVLGEIPDRLAALREVKRVLRPGGRLSVSEQFPDPDFITRRSSASFLRGAGFHEQSSRGHLVYTSTWTTAA